MVLSHYLMQRKKVSGFQFNLKAITDCDSIRLRHWLTKVSPFSTHETRLIISNCTRVFCISAFLIDQRKFSDAVCIFNLKQASVFMRNGPIFERTI